jgi:hypothetical protein
MDVDNVDKVPANITFLGMEDDYFDNQKLQTVEMLQSNFDPLLHNPVRHRHDFQYPNFRA